MVTGVLRNRALLDHFILQVGGRPLDRIDPPVLDALRLGAQQIAFMRIPDHAAVSETVDAAGRIAPKARGFVNAILRKMTRVDLKALTPTGADLGATAVRLSHPLWLLKKWASRYGSARAEAIAAANQQPSVPDLLVNTTRIEMGEAIALLEQRRIPFIRSTLLPTMVRLTEGSTSPVASEIESGLFHPLDEGSAMVAEIARRVSTGQILDAAAAPGSKTIYLGCQGLSVVSSDIDLPRLRMLRSFWTRSFSSPHSIVVADATRPPFDSFDTVLIDAPCSATGIIRKYPEIRWRLDPSTISSYGRRQLEILRGVGSIASRHVVYSTCSIEPEENDHVVREFLDSTPGWELGDIAAVVPSNIRDRIDRGALRLLPDQGTDGFTVFVLTHETAR